MIVKLPKLHSEARIKLVEDLRDSIAADHNALLITPEQQAELDRRLEAYAADKIRGRTAADILVNVRQRL